MSLSHGMQSYIDQMENDTMASYPIEIQANSSDMSTLMTTMMGMKKRQKNIMILKSILVLMWRMY